MARIDETLLWLCSIASPIGEEGPICDAVTQRVCQGPLASGVRRYGNSIVVPVLRGTGPKIALAGHLDVVRTEHEHGPRIEGDRLYGPGASDMKSGLAVMLDLLEADFLRTLNFTLTLVFYAREEGPFAENELGPVLEQDPELRHHDFVVCLEPSDNRLQLGCNGSLHAQVVFEGRTAHSSRPWQGENAIHKSAAFLARLAASDPIEYADGELVYHSVISATLAEGGRGRNVIPDRFTLNVNHRFTPGTTVAQAEQRVLDLVAGQAKVTFTDKSPSGRTFADHPMVDLLKKAGVATVEAKQAWTDVARFSELGVPAVNLGPGINSQAHQKNEYTSLALLHEGRAIFERWLKLVDQEHSAAAK